MKLVPFLSFIAFTLIMSGGCSKENDSSLGNNSNASSITTAPATNITNNSALTGGLISSDGGNSIIQRGVCWSENPNPTIADTSLNNGLGIGSFNCLLTNLNPVTTYYVRAYAISATNIIYGNQITFTTTGNGGSTDITPPQIILIGDAVISIDLQQPYVELGAYAIDNVDGQIPVQITGAVNINLKGQYVITYTAEDSAGNVATEDRIVNVVVFVHILATCVT